MTNQATFGIAIVADDKTAKGAKSAEKRLGQIPKHYGVINRKAIEEGEKAAGRSGRSILGTFTKVEQAGAKFFGGRSITTGLTSRLGAVREAAAAAGEGMGEAASAGGALEGALGGLGMVAGATVGILAAAGYAAFKLADGWAKGAASIGRTADTIGVATKALQEFQAAGERAGVDKAASTSALAGIAQTLNDARYGRNNDALALMLKLGMRFKLGPDGQIDTAAMSMDLADAIARQHNAQSRRKLASVFGIGDAALPMFLQGSGQLRSDMADADVHGGVLSDDDIRLGRRIARKSAIVGQMKDRAMMRAGEALSGPTEAGYDAVISGGRAIMDGGFSFDRSVRNDFVPAARKIDQAAGRMERASGSGSVIGISRQVVDAARAAERRFGIPASISLGQYALESGYGRHMPAGSNNPFGIKARPGEPFVLARTTEVDRNGRAYSTMARFRQFSSLEEAFEAHAQLLQGSRYARARHALPSIDGFADALTGVYATDPHYGEKLRRLVHSDHLDRYDHSSVEPIPVKVEIEMRGAPAGTRAKVTAGRSSQPAVSHAFVIDPVHGG